MDDDIDEPPEDEPDDAEVAEDLDEADVDEEEDDDLGEEGLGEEGLEEESGSGEPVTVPAPRETGATDEAEDLAEAEESEAGLDEILRERLRPGETTDDEEEEAEKERPVATRDAEVSPRRAHEFVCRSCFLVKSNNQLADPDRLLCTDCVGSG